jgi:hypothetical protein
MGSSVGPSPARWSWAHTDRAVRLLALAVMMGGAGWLATSSLQQDFAAYYTAGGAVARGLDPYVNHVAEPLATTGVAEGPVWDGVAVYRHSRFLYAPLLAHLFRPLAALPYEWAKAIFTALSLGALWLAVALVVPPPPPSVSVAAGREPVAGPAFMRAPWVLGVIWSPVFLTLERGQVELLLLAALAAAWRWRARAAIAGGLLAVAVLVKPLAAGVLPVLVAGRRWRWALAAVGGLMVLLGLNVVVAGPAATASFLTEVLPRAARFGEGGPAAWLLPDDALASRADDLEAGRARIGGGPVYVQEVGTFRRNASLPRLLTDAGETPRLALGALVALGLIGAAAWAARRTPEGPYGYWAGLVAGVVAAPVSWAMGLVWALPVLALIPLPLGLRSRHTREVPRAAARLCFLALLAALAGPLLAAAWIVAGTAVIAAAVVAAARPGQGGGEKEKPREAVA